MMHLWITYSNTKSAACCNRKYRQIVRLTVQAFTPDLKTALQSPVKFWFDDGAHFLVSKQFRKHIYEAIRMLLQNTLFRTGKRYRSMSNLLCSLVAGLAA